MSKRIPDSPTSPDAVPVASDGILAAELTPAAKGNGYWIADALTMTIQVLKELYAESNQTGYIGRLETDGAPVLAEAFARVKLA